jgi:hypothetical protein
VNATSPNSDAIPDLIPDPLKVRDRLCALAAESRLLRSLYRIAKRAHPVASSSGAESSGPAESARG